jgi:hypothetical protein
VWLPSSVSSENFVSTLVIDLARRRKFKPDAPLRLPSGTAALARAEALQRELEAGGLRRADLARRHGLTRARITQILGLLTLDPAVREFVSSRPAGPPGSAPTERHVLLIARLAAGQVERACATLPGFSEFHLARRAPRAS